jgi:hypothetical protein
MKENENFLRELFGKARREKGNFVLKTNFPERETG